MVRFSNDPPPSASTAPRFSNTRSACRSMSPLPTTWPCSSAAVWPAMNSRVPPDVWIPWLYRGRGSFSDAGCSTLRVIGFLAGKDGPGMSVGTFSRILMAVLLAAHAPGGETQGKAGEQVTQLLGTERPYHAV